MVDRHDVQARKKALQFLHGITAAVELRCLPVLIDELIKGDSSLVEMGRKAHDGVHENCFCVHEVLPDFRLVKGFLRHVKDIVELLPRLQVGNFMHTVLPFLSPFQRVGLHNKGKLYQLAGILRREIDKFLCRGKIISLNSLNRDIILRA